VVWGVGGGVLVLAVLGGGLGVVGGGGVWVGVFCVRGGLGGGWGGLLRGVVVVCDLILSFNLQWSASPALHQTRSPSSSFFVILLLFHYPDFFYLPPYLLFLSNGTFSSRRKD